MSLPRLTRPPHPHHPRTKPSADTAIQSTDTDALTSRLSAIHAGYLDDAFSDMFLPAQGPGEAQGPRGRVRKMPVINRGTYVRCVAVDALVREFLRGGGGGTPRGGASEGGGFTRQIVSLGAGSDSRYFRMRAEKWDGWETVVYHEVDYGGVVARKKEVLVRESAAGGRLAGVLSGVRTLDAEAEGGDGAVLEGNAGGYTLHDIDLRTIPSRPPSWLPRNMDPSLPTLLLSECLLLYLPPTDGTALLSRFAAQLPHLGVALYEPLTGGPGDPFGDTMLANLAARGLVLGSLRAYPSVEAQLGRLRAVGLERVEGRTVREWWERGVGAEEKARVGRVEMLDEVEEWELLAGHYFVGWGWRGKGWDGWEGI